MAEASTRSKPAEFATRTQLRSLGRLINRNRHNGVTATQVADRAGRSIGYISEITRGLLPGGRRVSVVEYQRLRQIIFSLAEEGSGGR